MLLELPWSVQSEAMCREFMGAPVPSEFAKTRRGVIQGWDDLDISRAFGVPRTGTSWLSRGDDRVRGCFAGKIDDKEGWSMDQCTDPRLRRLFYFLIPILHLEKPKRVTIKMGSTIVAAFLESQEVNWASIIKEIMKRQVGNLRGTKAISLSTYLYLYYAEEK